MGEAKVQVVGGGLAGCEAAWQLAERGVRVRLSEMRPQRSSPAHKGDGLAELVCSNSLRSDDPGSAVGLLHQELRRLGSLILSCADQTRVPAGGALAVDRELFSRTVTERIASHPLIELVREEVERLPAGPAPAIVASGPLTSEPISAELASLLGERLYFYDAIAPIVAADSIDTAIAFYCSRYGKGGGEDEPGRHFLGHLDAVKPSETAAEQAAFWARYFGREPAEAIKAMNRVGLSNREQVPGRGLSAGQKRRLALVRLLVEPRPVWLLDEPTAALDVEGRALVTQLVGEHRDRGGMVIAAIHGDGFAGSRTLDVSAFPARAVV